MSKVITIQDFSERTGVSKSALRFYESKNLLHPVGRNASGYRVYAEEQVAIAKLISSLRLADVPIKDIDMYIKEQDEGRRQRMMGDWITTIKQRIGALNVSLRYLESNSTLQQIHLIERAAEMIIWFSAEAEIGKFREHFMKRGEELQQLHLPIKNCYLKYIAGNEVVKAHIGFGIPNASEISGIEFDSIEQMASCMCIALSYNEPIMDIQNGYRKLINYAAQHEWVPLGSILEWYHGNDFTEIDLLMPVTQLGGMVNGASSEDSGAKRGL